MTRVREASHTVAFIADYCAHYRGLFANVRHFEQFCALHLGLLAETKRKSLPRMPRTAKADAQALSPTLRQPGGFWHLAGFATPPRRSAQDPSGQDQGRYGSASPRA